MRQTYHRTLPIEALVPSPHNRRPISDTDPALKSLAESIAAVGLLEPVLVRTTDRDGVFEIMAGHRRHRAVRLALLPSIECIVHQGLTDAEAKAITLVENLQREGIHWLDEALLVAELLDAGTDPAEVAAQVGHDQRWVQGRASLRGLIQAWVDAIRQDGDRAWVGISHAELIARLPMETQAKLLEDLSDFDEYSAKELEDLIERRYTRALSTAPWALDDLALYPAAKACTDCPKRASCQTVLWPDLAGNDRCLDATCWTEKNRRWIVGKAASLVTKASGPVALITSRGDAPLGDLPAGIVEVSAEYHVTPAKKSTPGAVQALDARTGKTSWVLPSAQYCPPAVAKALGQKATPASAKTASGEPKGPNADDRRTAKRLTFRLSKLAEEATEALEVPAPERLLQIFAVVALEGGNLRKAEAWKRIDVMSPETARDLLWSDLVERLHNFGSQPVFATQLDAVDASAIEHMEQLLQLDPAEQAAKALAEVPEPRSKAANLSGEG